MIAANLGFPRIGIRRELKFAVERYWSGEWDEASLLAAASRLRLSHWQLQSEAGIALPPSNDFSLYDHVLDTVVMTGAIPARFERKDLRLPLAGYFALARGAKNAAPLQMTKWFDTNYHYIVPEFEAGMEFRLSGEKAVEEYLEAKAAGFNTRPVLLGPVSFLLLGRRQKGAATLRTLVEQLLPVYEQQLAHLSNAGAGWVQIDEPCLGLDLDSGQRELYELAYGRLGRGKPKIMLAAYYGGLHENLRLALGLPVEGLHLDLVRDPGQLLPALRAAPKDMRFSLGLVDGRNIWRCDLDRALDLLRAAQGYLEPEQIQVAPSCTLLHVPIDLRQETGLDPRLRGWMAFAFQKLEEVALLARAASTENSFEIAQQFAAARRRRDERRIAPETHKESVRARTGALRPAMFARQQPYSARRLQQAHAVPLPLLPSTTIGSFPQTAEIRRARAGWRSGLITQAEYETFLRLEIERAIRFQEAIGLDVLVHGEFERCDMVEYFGERLEGFAMTTQGWVQSYGSRCVKPPILYGDIERRRPMTLAWSRYAQALTDRPVKGMLTGPVTLLQWSFVRDDLPAGEIAFQLALALREEIADLESAGLRVIQVDEPALREGLPLRQADQSAYLQWAIAAFRLATSGVMNQTQIHTHMCYSDFRDFLPEMVKLDADVISVEAARSRMSLAASATAVHALGPGVYDIHSPRVPSVGELQSLIHRALTAFPPERLWINPDCGLKTRRWEEVRPALENMMRAARRVRAGIYRKRIQPALYKSASA